MVILHTNTKKCSISSRVKSNSFSFSSFVSLCSLNHSTTYYSNSPFLFDTILFIYVFVYTCISASNSRWTIFASSTTMGNGERTQDHVLYNHTPHIKRIKTNRIQRSISTHISIKRSAKNRMDILFDKTPFAYRVQKRTLIITHCLTL